MDDSTGNAVAQPLGVGAPRLELFDGAPGTCSTVPVARVDRWNPTDRDLDDAYTSFDADALRRGAPAVRWIWHNAIAQGVVTNLAAEGGTGKGFLTVALAVCRALRLPFLGRALLPGRTLFLTAEDKPVHYLRKIEAVLKSGLLPPNIDHDLIASNIGVLYVGGRGVKFARSDHGSFVIDPIVKTIGEWIYRAEIRGQPFDLTICDNASRFGAGETHEPASALMDALEQLQEAAHTTPLLVGHTGKTNGKGQGDGGRDDAYAFRGASCFADNARGSLLLRRSVKGEPKGFVFMVTRVSHGPDRQEPTYLDRIEVKGVGVAFRVHGEPTGVVEDRDFEVAVDLRPERDKDAAMVRALVAELHDRRPDVPVTTNALQVYRKDRLPGIARDRLTEVLEYAVAEGFLVPDTRMGRGIRKAGFLPGGEVSEVSGNGVAMGETRRSKSPKSPLPIGRKLRPETSGVQVSEVSGSLRLTDPAAPETSPATSDPPPESPPDDHTEEKPTP